MHHRRKIEAAPDVLTGSARAAIRGLGTALILVLSACATLAPAKAPDEATAIRIACVDARALGHKCGFVSASLNGGIWRVLAPYNCPKGLTCVGGDMYALVSKGSGRVVEVVLGEQNLAAATAHAHSLDQ
jgi:hypothetical protein